MILLDIINGIDKKLVYNDSIDFTDYKSITLKFINNYENYDEIVCEFLTNIIDTKNIKKDSIIDIKCKIIEFLGSGSYGKVFKIKINKKYYALKINENEIPINLQMRYESLVNVEQLKKYIINIYISGNLNSDKYKYFSIMEYGGHSLKSQIPFKTSDEIKFIMRQLYNIVYLCERERLYLTDFKFNNIVLNKNDYRLKLIDIYIQCKSYNPCNECRIVKTYSTLEMDRIKNILDDKNYNHTYHYIPLGVGLIDLLCKKSFSNIISILTTNYNIDLNLKQTIPLIQVSIYNFDHESNSLVKQEYYPVYKIKKKIENKFPIVKNNLFYKYLMNLIQVRDIYKNVIPTKILHKIIHNLFSAYPNERTLDPLKNHLKEFM
jgi:serine/threonine protein kinase